MDAKQLLFALLRNVICGEPLSDDAKNVCTPETLERTYQLANHHDLAHLVGQALSKLELPESEAGKKCKSAAMMAVYRYTRIAYEYQRICETLENAQIPFIPLKGSVLRDHYPEPWMRTSCDIDILVRVEILEEAAQLLVDKLNFDRQGKGDHDISLYSPNGVHLELHYLAVDEGRMPEAQKVLADIWTDAKPMPGKQCHYVMSDEMFYFYHIAHMAKHFNIGGCGIRPFLDMWIMNHQMHYCREMREKLLQQGAMLQFETAAEKLSEMWFSGVEMDVLSKKLESFILEGGVYGTTKSLVTVSQSRKGNKVKYMLSRIFLPYQRLKYQYPILQKHRWLTPVYQVVRWCKLLFNGGLKRSMHEMRINATLSPEEIGSAEELIKYLGI